MNTESNPVTVTIALPWSAPLLSMNDRGYTRGAAMAKAAKIRELRQTMVALAIHHNLPRGLLYATVCLHYQPRDRRRRDTDNLTATAKPLYDGLASGGKTLVGYGLVPDDTPEFMAKNEPVIHAPVKGEGGRMWLEITYTAEEEAA
ncbi:crossover junction endodeoxyribonuclease RusA [Nocardia ignorata]|uniref:Crossover junction endodeoxyribonuclease RusA n=1 Tax=Nocardia ignorata TaxID=145285 RepID=A0A4V3CMJ2_NOCIG|nr:crossover junction endodeoxyribonuclease RusA [Nocardia ignorata]